MAVTIDDFHVEPLLALARERSGVAGLDDRDLIDPLTRVLASYRAEAGFPERGVQAMHMHLLDLLTMRIRILDTIRKHPEILQEQIKAPVIILGLPRTGSTKLQRVLSATGEFQSLPLWRIFNPLPLPTDKLGEDSRIAYAEQLVAGMKQFFPRFYAGHPMVATEPDEEALLLEMTFDTDAPCWLARVPSYQAWLLGHNNEWSYRWLKNVLQLLQWQDERASPARPWVLKSPVHIGRLDEIFAVFPDAIIVNCHRDLNSSVPSGAALLEAMWGLYADNVDAHQAGRVVMDLLTHSMQSYVDARGRWEAKGKTFVDVHFADVVGNMDAVAAKVFAKRGIAFTDKTSQSMKRWEAANPPFKHGEFAYDLARYGLSAEQIKTTFKDYLAKYAAA